MRKFDLLIALYIFCIAVSELMGAKTFPIIQTDWLTLNSSVAIFTLPLIFSINDVVTEVCGRERTRSIIRSGLIVVALLFLFAWLVTSLPPSVRFAPTEAAYDAIFHSSMRMAFASLMAFALAEFTDLFVFVKIRSALGAKALWLRNNVSNWVSQFLDSAIFLTLAFFAFDKGLSENIAFLWSLLLPYWLLKCLMSALVTPLVYWGVKWLREDQTMSEHQLPEHEKERSLPAGNRCCCGIQYEEN